MSFQKCPVCNGVGIVSGGYFARTGDSPYFVTGNTTDRCQICKGTGLIDEVTGQPPAKDRVEPSK